MIARRRLLSTTLLAAAAVPVRAAAQPSPPARNRAGWEADESLRFGPDGTELFPTAFFDVQTFTVHHTVTANADPTPAARETLVGLLAGLCALTRVDPQARVLHVNPISGATRDGDAIAGHRDWLATEFPGNAFHPTLPDLRREVAALLRPAPLGEG